MAAPAAASWATTRVYGTWHGQAGGMLAGTYKVTIPARVTNTTDDVIIPKGTYAQGSLNTTPGDPSFDLEIPCNDDPDNSPNGWQPVVEITFSASGVDGEKYLLDTPVGVEVNLRTVVLASTIPNAQDVLIRGVPGGLAELDADGDVIDAAGEKVTAGSGVDEGAVVTIIEANPQAPAADSVTDAKVPTGAAIALAKTADSTASAGRLAMTNAERTKLTGVATGATANSADATLLARASHTGTQSADTLTDGTTNKAFLASERTKLSGVATGATANDTDANLKARANHTGTQAQSTVTNLVTDLAALVPHAGQRIRIAATALNTWPARTASLPSGFAGPAEWDHSAYGAVSTLPSDIATNDIVTDLAP